MTDRLTGNNHFSGNGVNGALNGDTVVNGNTNGDTNGDTNGITYGSTKGIGHARMKGTTEHNKPNSHGEYRPFVPEPIAICGIGLRLPGGINTGDSFWDVLHNGVDLRGPIPADRFNVGAFDDSLGKKASIATRYGYFLDEDLGVLDASMFHMSKLELEKTDPQQRKVLEVARECLENAGETAWRGKPIGVYVGTFGDDWLLNLTKEAQFTGGYNLSGDLMIANRISYEYDLKGPSLVVKTGCSASLVAVHEACRNLQQGDCSAALVCGTSLIMGPHVFSVMTGEGILSPDGSCKTFDASADGFARADGINAVYLKRLSDAIKDGNPIRAIIRNSGNNSDGKSQGLLSPSSAAQEALMRHVYTQAHLDPAETGFFEFHGTGTATGDPIEATAVANLFGDAGVYVGSVKPNTGHSEGASGLTSLIKAVLSLEHKIIPPNIKFSTPNPKIPFAEKRLKVPIVPTTWPQGRAERISVNSFGIGGSNAHIIVDSAEQFFANNPDLQPPRQLRCSAHAPSLSRLLLFSAHAPGPLKNIVKRYGEYNHRHPENANDLAYTLAFKREKLDYRSFALISASGDVGEAAPVAQVPINKQTLVMVFSGQGAQWPQMGRELLLNHPIFAQSIEEMDSVLHSLVDAPQWWLKDELLKSKETSQVYRAELSQPLTTSLQLGLVNVLRELGMRPAAVIGHSSGEIAAAYAAGLLSMRQAIIISYLRGLTTKFNPRKGGMAAIGLGASTIESYLLPAVVVAAENSPNSTTISGDVEILDQVLESIKSDFPDILVRKLQVDIAYHSPSMSIIGKRYMEAMQKELGVSNTSLSPNASSTSMFSTVTGKVITEPLDLNYWIINLTSTVRFSTGFAAMLAALQDQPLFIEIGPHSQMAGPIRQNCTATKVQSFYVPTMIRTADCFESLLSALGQLFQRNVELDISADSVLFPQGQTLIDAPLYDWDHSDRFWHENRISHDFRFRKYGHHALLGSRTSESSTLEPAWRCVLDLEDEPWLKHHVVDTNTVFPFSGYISMAGEAVRQVSNIERGFKAKHVVVHAALILTESRPVELVTTLRKKRMTDSANWDYYDFVISSFSGSVWTKHCEGSVKPLDEQRSTPANVRTLARKVRVSRWYEVMARTGLSYGQTFQGIKFLEASTTDPRVIAGIAKTADGPFLFHPGTMDSAFQLVIAAGAKGMARNLKKLVVPTLIEEIEVFAMPDRMIAEAWAFPDSKDVGLLCTTEDRVVLSVKGAKLTPLENDIQTGSRRHMAARMEYFPDIDFTDVSSLVDAPTVGRRSRVVMEEIVLLSILDTADRIKSLEPSQPHYQRYREWIVRECERVTQENSSFEEINGRYFKSLNADQRLVEIEKRLAKMSKKHSLSLLARGIHKVNKHCEDLFTGKMDALAMLLEENVLTEIYNSVSFDFSKYVKLLCLKKPTLRILEVGAGTGGATDLILKDLVGVSRNAPYSIYTFTDISAGFFAQAAERFKYAPNMDYKVFDISDDPFKQGFLPESYDLIIANNVIHATPNLQATLRNLQPLLRPDGQLLLSEVCATAAKAPGFVFGQFSGWWMGEADDRYWEPFVPVDRWERELKKAGFTGVDTVIFDEEEPYQYCAAMVSRSMLRTVKKQVVGTGFEVTVLCDFPDRGPSAKLIAKLRSSGYDVVAARFGNSDLPSDRHVLVTLDLEGYFYQDITADRLLALQKICQSHQRQKLLWLMPPVQIGCIDPRHGQTIGAMRIIREELSLPFFTLEVAQSEPEFADLILRVLNKILDYDDVGELIPDMEYVVHGGVVKIGRCQPFSLDSETTSWSTTAPTVKRLNIGSPGLLETLHWISTGPNSIDADVVEVETRAVGLNFRDIMVAMGILTFGDGTPQLGIEMSGIVTQIGAEVQNVKVGDRVIAVAIDGCFSTRAVVKAELVCRIPDSLSFEDAATLPTVYGTVIQALMRTSELEKGKTVLIHSACGGIGHAAVQLCKYIGAEIYVTVGSRAKAQYAENAFGIPKNHIFNSRDESFVAGVMRETCGKGVDIVLNSLSGKLLHASWECVAEFGQLVELGKRDLVESGSLQMEPFLLNRSYCCVDLAHMLQRRPRKVAGLLQEAIELLSEGKIQPITNRAEYRARDIEQAFRHMQKGDHIGKVIVTMPAPEQTSDLPSRPGSMDLRFDSSATYLITGGLGGVGKSVASWMAERGARSLIFLSRTAGKGEHDRTFFTELQTLGCTAISVPGQVQVAEDVERAISRAPTPIKGVLHLAMVLRDGPFTDLTFEDWTETIDPKVKGAWNLHNSLIGRNQELDFFIMSSSIAAVAHHPGQANYAAANTFLESFVQYRRRLGLPAAVVGLCAVDDVGFVADNPIVRRKLRSQGVQFLSEQSLLEYFQFGMTNQRQDVVPPRQGTISDPLAPQFSHGYTIAGLHSDIHLDDPKCPTVWRRNRKMGMYHNVRAVSVAAGSDGPNGLKVFLEQATMAEDPAAYLREDDHIDYLATEIGLRIYQSMMRDTTDLDISASLKKIGLDSLMAIELRRWWKQLFFDVTVLEIMGGGTLRQLGELASEGLIAKISNVEGKRTH